MKSWDNQLKALRDESAQHTPTPWGLDSIDDTAIMSSTSNGHYIASCDRGDLPQEICRANAEFIVRAVNSHAELLKLVEALLPTSYAHYGHVKDVSHGEGLIQEKARAAISAARGGTA
jgi:hypothetical protein